MKKVSICVPTYNNPENVKKLFSTILEQTFQDFEVIITDDSTNNEIEELVQKYSDLDIIYIHNEMPLGHVINWNKSMSYATGEYMKIMFSDDWFTSKDSLQQFVSMLDDNPKASLAFSGTMQVSEKKSYSRCASEITISRMKEDIRYSFVDYQIGAPSATIYRGCKARFDEETGFASDMDLHLSILIKDTDFICTKTPLISIGIHQEQYTATFSPLDNRRYQDFEYIYRKYKMWDNLYCRRYFIDYIIRYKKGCKLAIELNYKKLEYVKFFVSWHWKNTVIGFIKSIPYKCKKIAKKCN